MNAKPLTRIYFPEEIPPHGGCVLPAERAHHAGRVLRLEAGDAVTLFDGRGFEYAATIERVAKAGITLKVGDARAVDRESPLRVTLAQGISSGERMDYTIQKAVELGAAGIQPLESARSVVRLNAERARKRVAHWQAVCVAACEQCGRNRVPEVAEVTTLRGWLGHGSETKLSGQRLMLSPRAQLPLRALPEPQGVLILLAGPEGGFAPEEEEDAQRAGFIPVRLGPRVLRTETAAITALAALQALWGDF